MSNSNFSRAHARRATSIIVVFAALLLFAQATTAATWKGIEPFVSRRADVERTLGAPVEDKMSENGLLRFKVSGGTVTVFFVTAKFVETKKLAPKLEGTVLQIVLQHEHAADTPESMSLLKDKAYQHQSNKEMDVYLNSKQGISYTFVEGKLKTTRYVYASEQLARLGRKG
ncbi:MAG: hypothetical protein LC754_10230 [Acidobacteria bacterium]|nr:hypothetical protein [Acidobacteriota bacterium]